MKVVVDTSAIMSKNGSVADVLLNPRVVQSFAHHFTIFLVSFRFPVSSTMK